MERQNLRQSYQDRGKSQGGFGEFGEPEFGLTETEGYDILSS